MHNTGMITSFDAVTSQNTGRRLTDARSCRFGGVLLTALLLAAINGGCMSGYVGNRARDAADIMTFTLGAGSGIKARVGPLQLAAFENTDLMGLRAGLGFLHGADLVDNKEAYSPLPVFGNMNWADPVAVDAFTYGKHTVDEHRGEREYIHSRPQFPDWAGTFGREIFQHDPETSSERRGKGTLAAAPLPVLVRSRPPAFYTQIEIAGGLLFTLRLGVNPGEFIDFVLGFTGIDLFGDDLKLDRANQNPPR